MDSAFVHRGLLFTVYEACVVKAGLMLAPFKCKDLKFELKDCVDYWHESEELLSRAKKEYLEDRSEFRRTGVCKQNREFLQNLIREEQANGKQAQS